jgi:hypothetical protein
MAVTDVWRLSQYHKLITNKKEEDGKNVLTIKQFTSVLAKHLIKIEISCENEADFCGSPTTASRSSSISPLSSDESTDYSGGAECTDTEGKFHAPSLLPMTEQKSGKKHRAIACGARSKAENYTVLYGLVTLVPIPFACEQATTTALTVLHFMLGTVDHRKQPANAVALGLTLN